MSEKEKEVENFEGISDADLLTLSNQILRSPFYRDSQFAKELMQELEKRGVNQKNNGG